LSEQLTLKARLEWRDRKPTLSIEAPAGAAMEILNARARLTASSLCGDVEPIVKTVSRLTPGDVVFSESDVEEVVRRAVKLCRERGIRIDPSSTIPVKVELEGTLIARDFPEKGKEQKVDVKLEAGKPVEVKVEEEEGRPRVEEIKRRAEREEEKAKVVKPLAEIGLERLVKALAGALPGRELEIVGAKREEKREQQEERREAEAKAETPAPTTPSTPATAPATPTPTQPTTTTTGAVVATRLDPDTVESFVVYGRYKGHEVVASYNPGAQAASCRLPSLEPSTYSWKARWSLEEAAPWHSGAGVASGYLTRSGYGNVGYYMRAIFNGTPFTEYKIWMGPDRWIKEAVVDCANIILSQYGGWIGNIKYKTEEQLEREKALREAESQLKVYFDKGGVKISAPYKFMLRDDVSFEITHPSCGKFGTGLKVNVGNDGILVPMDSVRGTANNLWINCKDRGGKLEDEVDVTIRIRGILEAEYGGKKVSGRIEREISMGRMPLALLLGETIKLPTPIPPVLPTPGPPVPPPEQPIKPPVEPIKPPEPKPPPPDRYIPPVEPIEPIKPPVQPPPIKPPVEPIPIRPPERPPEQPQPVRPITPLPVEPQPPKPPIEVQPVRPPEQPQPQPSPPPAKPPIQPQPIPTPAPVPTVAQTVQAQPPSVTQPAQTAQPVTAPTTQPAPAAQPARPSIQELVSITGDYARRLSRELGIPQSEATSIVARIMVSKVYGEGVVPSYEDVKREAQKQVRVWTLGI